MVKTQVHLCGAHTNGHLLVWVFDQPAQLYRTVKEYHDKVAIETQNKNCESHKDDGSYHLFIIQMKVMSPLIYQFPFAV